MIQAKVVADSITAEGARITTMECTYPRFIHSEVMTHRVFSRNAMSSRAVPVAKMLEQVRNSPATPVHWGANRPGMQAGEELTGGSLEEAKFLWFRAAQQAAGIAEDMAKVGLHKQVANRVLEPFQLMRTLITATEWDNFFALRAHPAAAPEFQALAYAMQDARNASAPVMRRFGEGQASWHLPYVTDEERRLLPLETLRMCSAARCARVSYLNHEKQNPSVVEDVDLFGQLVVRPYVDRKGRTYSESDPLHASPIEHQAVPAALAVSSSRNFRGWLQFRELYEEGRC